MKMKFKPYVKVLLNEKEKKVIFSKPLANGDYGDSYELTTLGVTILKCLTKGITKEELVRELNIFSSKDLSEMDDILELLFLEGYAGNELESIPDKYLEMNQIYNRIIPIWGEIESSDNNRYQIHHTIMNKKVGIIGCGTVGMGIVSKLVTCGIGNYVLVDDDVVSRSNLTRQSAFRLTDIGKSKVNVVKTYIEDRVEQAEVTIVPNKIRTIEDLYVFNEMDILVVASDQPGIEILVQEYANTYKKTISFSGGYTGSTGKVFPTFIPGKTHQYQCVVDFLHNVAGEDTIGFTNINTEFKVSSLSPVADLIVSITAFEIIKYLTETITPFILDKVLFINFSNFTIEEIVINQKNCNCLSQPVTL